VLLALSAALGLGACTRRAATNERAGAGTASAGAAREPVRIPPFRFVDQRGQSTSEADLAGHVWVFDFVYTSCTSVCPTLTAKLALLERRLDDPGLRFVSFSVDPEHDTPEALASYAERFRPGETRWLLLRTNTTELTSFAHAVGADVRKTQDASDPIRHSTLFFLVNREGVVSGKYESTDPSALVRLERDAAALAGTSASLPSGADGAQLLGSLGCNGCHEQQALAPSLSGLWGTEVDLADGNRVRVNEAYLRESLLEPGAKIVRGYVNIMPAYGSELSGPALDALVTYLRTARATSSGGVDGRTHESTTADEGSAVDPVCGMEVRRVRAPRIDYSGRRYFFCSDTCRSKFEADPRKYVAKGNSSKAD
jgi:protein SCO1/2